MARPLAKLMFAAFVCVLLVAPALLQAQNMPPVQDTSADAKVLLAAEANSAVVTPVPVGAMLEVISANGNYFQVKLPKDASGFDRVGFILKSQVKAMAASSASSSSSSNSSGAAAPAPSGGRPLSAIMDFEYGTVQAWWSGTWDIGKGIADMLADELLQTGQIRLLERAKISQVLGEQDLANSNRADPSAAQNAQMGKVLGARVLIMGSITKFGSEEQNVGGGGGLSGRFLGGLGTRNTTAVVAITARAVDSSTSEHLASAKGEAKSNRRGLLVGGAGGGAFGGISMQSKDFKETILGEATEKAVKELAGKLATAVTNAVR